MHKENKFQCKKVWLSLNISSIYIVPMTQMPSILNMVNKTPTHIYKLHYVHTEVDPIVEF